MTSTLDLWGEWLRLYLCFIILLPTVLSLGSCKERKFNKYLFNEYEGGGGLGKSKKEIPEQIMVNENSRRKKSEHSASC